ncbi:MAG: D-alanyl-D-alanine carboxypeptidase/D-alanyl-D-alanine-endopeptidase [Ferruginibacter sp.]
MKTFNLLPALLLSVAIHAQPVKQQLATAIGNLEKDGQMRHASFSLYVVNSRTGEIVFQKDEQRGLAPASTQKVITAVTAYELLGKSFQYQSELGYDGRLENGVLNGQLIFRGSGDPTLGSWRWKQTSEDTFAQKIAAVFKTKKIRGITGGLLVDESAWESQATPDDWTWDDTGNYYGAGVWGVNWHENQYDLFLRPGKNIGDPAEVLSTDPALPAVPVLNELTTAKAGSGDNSIIYFPENGRLMAIRGTIPAGVEKFKVSGSFPNAPVQLAMAIEKSLEKINVQVDGKAITAQDLQLNNKKPLYTFTPLAAFQSPPLDSMGYWFLKESINLYGEAFVKTMAFKKNGRGEEKAGLDIIKNFWTDKGIDKAALNMKDGSGLSPANRITTYALVTALQYARQQVWYTSFENALPLQNGLKMKSGYINGVRSYAGYIKSKSGEEYTFAFIINNFDGAPGPVREKMWKILDLMK